MARRRWVWDNELKELVEVSVDRGPSTDSRLSALWGDRHYDGLQATDGTDISTRKKHREYMKRHGLTTADDFKGDWDRAKKEREHYMQNGGTVTKRDIREVIERLSQR